MDQETLGAALALAKKTIADPSVIEEKVNDWLDDHPEKTTTVQDGAVSYSKLDASLKEKADDVSTLKSAMQDKADKKEFESITKTSRNMFDDAALRSAGIASNSAGYYYAKVRDWVSAFSTLFPVADSFASGKQYTISCTYYFGDVGSYSGFCIAIKSNYTDSTNSNTFSFTTAKTTPFYAAASTSSSKSVDHLSISLIDSRANDYILFIKDLQIEEGATATEYIAHRFAYDPVAELEIAGLVNNIQGIDTQFIALEANTQRLTWETGAFNGTTGAQQASTIRVRTKELFYLHKGTKIFVDTGYMYRLFRYSQNSYSSFVAYYDYNYDSSLHWITGYFEAPESAYYGITASDYAGSTVTDAEAVGAHIHVEPVIALNDLKDSVSLGIMPYNLTGLNSYIETIVGMNGDVILPLVTDIHGGYPDTYAVINYLANSGIGNYMFEMGDMIQSSYPTRAEAVAYLRKSIRTIAYTKTNTPIILLQGNHDTNPVSGTDTSKNITQEIFYNLSMARSKDVQQPSQKAYGYVDIDAAKVRIIYLNTSDIYSPTTGDALVTGQYTMIQQGQLDWFTGTALNFSDKGTPTDWSVIIVSHDSLSQIAAYTFAAILTAFTSGTTASGTQTVTVGTYSNVLNFDCDYTNQGGIDVICEVNGHHHKDMIRELGTTGIKQVYIACEGPASASYDDNGTTVYYTRNRGTTDEHLIDTLVLDKANRKVYFKRFGVGEDREISY